MGILDFFGRTKPAPDKIPAKSNGAQDQGRARSAIARDAVKEPTSTAELVRSVESDPQFLLGKLVIKSLVCSAKVSIECDEAHRAEADELTELWNKVLPDAFECFGYGRVCFEKRYGAYANGRRPIAGLDPLPFEDTEMVLDDDGRFTGVKIKTRSETFTIGSDCVWWCALDATPKQPHGKSRYTGAPLKVWKWRQQSDKNWELFEKKFALGIGVMRAPSEYPGNHARAGDIGELSPDGRPADPMLDAMAMLETVGSGGYAVLPSESDANGRPYFDYTPPNNNNVNSSPLENRRRILDAMALRSLGVPERAVTQDEATGSYAMAEVHWKVLAYTCEEILKQILCSFQEGVVDPWSQANFGRHIKFSVVSQPIIDTSKQLVTDLVKTIIGANPALATEGVVDLAKLLEIADLPAGENLQEKLAKISAKEAQPATLPFPRFASLRRLSNTPPVNDTWEDIANKAIEETNALAEQIKTLPQSANAPVLLRQDTGPTGEVPQ